jgi:hypothetical protein
LLSFKAMKVRLKVLILGLALATAGSVASADLAQSNPWTDWSNKAWVVGLFELHAIRDSLNEHNLFDTTETYPQVKCPPEALTARTANGTCNDLKNPAMGAAGIRFGRNVPLEHSYPDDATLMDPNPRLVSQKLLTRHEMKHVEFLNLMAAAWIQFMVHDWFSHGENELALPYFVPSPGIPGEPFGDGPMLIPRTRLDKTSAHDSKTHAPTYLNENTHWFDASQVYGSSLAAQNELRSHQNGKMAVTLDGRLPVDPSTGIEKVGFKRNWWLGLSLMHNLFVLEHNSIADKLKATHPDWNDQKLFDVARLVNAAVIAKIHTVEWTPAMLPNSILKSAMQANWTGEAMVPTGKVWKHSPWGPLFGLVGREKNLHAVPYSLTEEFVSVYRMHSLLPENVVLSSMDDKSKKITIPLVDTLDELSHRVSDHFAMKDLFYSFGIAHPGALTLNNYPKFMQNIKIPLIGQFSFGKFDLGAVDILRDRERGVPRYNELRRLIGLKPLTSFEQFGVDPETLKNLKEVYRGDIEKVDLLVGCSAESVRPKGFGFGETAFQIFIVMASRRLQADRFFTTDYTEKVYSKEGLQWVDNATMKMVLLRHYPELADTLKGVDNAFNPWKP